MANRSIEDHLHPKSVFNKAELAKQDFLKDDSARLDYYLNPLNWNSISNLHLLNASQNRSKQNKSLIKWLEEKDCGIKRADLLLTENDSLHIEDFQAFCEARREALLQRLRRNVVVSGPLPVAEDVLDEDEETEAVA